VTPQTLLYPTAIGPRPTPEDYRPAAFAAFLPKIAEWLGQDLDAEEVTHVRDALDYGDGYEAARYLDRCSWCPDAALVEILDGFSLDEAEYAAMRTWRTAHGPLLDAIRPTAGDRVRITNTGETGTVAVYIDDDTALATLYLDGGPLRLRRVGWEFLAAIEPRPTLEIPT